MLVEESLNTALVRAERKAAVPVVWARCTGPGELPSSGSAWQTSAAEGELLNPVDRTAWVGGFIFNFRFVVIRKIRQVISFNISVFKRKDFFLSFFLLLDKGYEKFIIKPSNHQTHSCIHSLPYPQNRGRGKQREIYTHTHTDTHTSVYTHTHTLTHTHVHTHTHTHTCTCMCAHTHTHNTRAHAHTFTHTHMHTHTHTRTHKIWKLGCSPQEYGNGCSKSWGSWRSWAGSVKPATKQTRSACKVLNCTLLWFWEHHEMCYHAWNTKCSLNMWS